MFRAIIIALAGTAALSASATQAGESCSPKGNGGYDDDYDSVDREPQYTQKWRGKPDHDEPIEIEPVNHFDYMLFYQRPDWQQPKQLSFDNFSEAKQMSQLLSDNGYRVSMSKYEGSSDDDDDFDNMDGRDGRGKVGGGKMRGGKFGGGKLNNVSMQSQKSFEDDDEDDDCEDKFGKRQGGPSSDELFDGPIVLDDDVEDDDN